jgi:hypothetical protein
MKTLTTAWLIVMVLAGCATPRAATTPTRPTATTFTGEVWTWDQPAGTITLRQSGGQIIRVKAPPDQFDGLRLHQTVTIQGELAGPAEIERVMLPPGTLVPRGQADEMEVTGTIARVDPAGKAAINSARGPVEVWVAMPTTALRPGEEVRVRMQVQPLQVQRASPGEVPPAMPPPAPAIGDQPGDYATVRGPLRAVDPAGRLTVDSPRGPIQVLVPRPDRYAVGEFVEVRTAVVQAR